MANQPSIDDFRWLISAETAQLVASIPAAEANLPQNVERLRRALPPERVHLVLEQVELRQRARKKFRNASTMFFTRRGLEQATDQWTAHYKASRFDRREPVVDLCCGLGGDLLEIAAAHEATGVDRDPVAVLLAQENVRSRRAEASVLVGDVETYRFPPGNSWHIDPDRRPRGRRTTRPELHEPGPELVDQLRRNNPDGAVKLAPAADVPAEWSAEAELQWISFSRECRQLVAWFGCLADVRGRRRATTLVYRRPRSTDAIQWPEPFSVDGEPDLAIPEAGHVGSFIYEPDPAVLAAHLGGELAARHALAAIEPGGVYLTGEQAVDDPLLGGFVVEDVMPYDLRHVGRLLRQRQIGRLEIKARGTRHSPERIRAELRLRGDKAATLIVLALDNRMRIVLTRRIGDRW